MSVVIRARVQLQPGARLYYDCPIRGDSFEANRFFEKHRGKEAEFVGYAEELIGPLDHRGRIPGRYINPEAVIVRFDGEESRSLNIRHFVVLETCAAVFADGDSAGRLGDLLHPALFYSDDIVRADDPQQRINNDERMVGEVLVGKEEFAPGGVPRYFVMETDAEYEARMAGLKAKSEAHKGAWVNAFLHKERSGCNMPADYLALVRHGNVWALYEAPDLLSFENDEKEATFWARDGVSKRLSGKQTEEAGDMVGAMRYAYGYPLALAYQLFESGEADLILLSNLTPPKGQPGYIIRRLHDCFGEHRPRVRALTERMWHEQALAPAS